MTKHHERAFPLHPGVHPDWQDNAGMTKREHYAGLSMQAHRFTEPDQHPDKIALWAVADADALIAELAKGGAA